jgi:DNA-directed RNA polymerase sigma subunit (sigma70/sigma32)
LGRGDGTPGDLIQDAVNPHAVVEASVLKRSVAEAVSGLTEREQQGNV